MDLLYWLNKWYKSNCNGDWEHCYGIKIETLDNPGWSFSIDLMGTEAEDEIFNKIAITNSENDWMFCKVENNVFQADGDPDKLLKILETFKMWIEKVKKKEE